MTHQYTLPFTYDLPSPDLNFLASKNRIYDYANLYSFAGWLRKHLTEYNVTENRPVALLSESSDEMIFLIAGCFLLNIPFVPLNPDSTDSELKLMLQSISPGAIYSDENNRYRIDQNIAFKIPKSVLKSTAEPDNLDLSLENYERTLGLFFTSGTTGAPKLVPIKRRQIFFAATSSAENFKPGPNRYWLLCLPLNHIGGISIIIRSILYHSAIYRMNSFDEHQVRTFLSENKLFEVASLVPTMLIRLLDDPLFQLHLSFKAILLGGGPISLDLIKLASVRGIPIVSSYGMTETCAQIAANPMLKPSGVYNPKKSVGRVFHPNRVEIRDPKSGKKLPPLEQGTIWLKGPQVFDGYSDKSLNKNTFDKKGWFNTGDFGHVNRENQLFIDARRSDRIISGGENVDPIEVEAIINGIDDIDESAVFGVKDPKWGQKVIALLVSKNGSEPDNKSVKEILEKKLSTFKIPKEFLKVDSLPKTASGKIKRAELSSIYDKLKTE